jgi:hypothetical protein
MKKYFVSALSQLSPWFASSPRSSFWTSRLREHYGTLTDPSGAAVQNAK